MRKRSWWLVGLLTPLFGADTLWAQTLQERLLQEGPAALAADSKLRGNARRGAVLFHHPALGCVRCHAVDDPSRRLDAIGPNLAMLQGKPQTDDVELVTSVLSPSARVRENFETLTLVLADGRVVTGLKVHDAPRVSVRDASTGRVLEFADDDVVERLTSTQSVMPDGLLNSLQSRDQVLDLCRYLIEVRDGGVERARALQPPPGAVALRLPEYESRLDHAALIEGLDEAAFERGQAIYARVCQNCHGTLAEPGSLPTALRFGSGTFRSGHDPYALYQTITRGYGLMVPQTWMVPRQKYDVIHYIRETYLREHNPSQYVAVSDAYLASLPPGNTLGPEPVDLAPWSDMNYGPWMFNTIEVGRNGHNIAYKGLVVRLDAGPGGVSKGNEWMLFDHDTMRVSAGWEHAGDGASRLIDWQGIHFDGRHQAHPHASGRVVFANPTGPGWANPSTGTFDDNQRVLGRDGRRYGPLPADWAEYRGLHHAGDQLIVSYRIGDMPVLEQLHGLHVERSSVSPPPPGDADAQPEPETSPVFVRALELSPTAQTQRLLVATNPGPGAQLVTAGSRSVHFGTMAGGRSDPAAAEGPRPESIGDFRASGWLQVDDTAALDMSSHDFTITARIRTRENGVILAQTTPGPKWVPDGTVLFLRKGRLCYDIGWVGVVQSKRAVDDGAWHDIALIWQREGGIVTLVVDGEVTGSGRLSPKNRLPNSVVRIGYGTPDFPDPSAFRGSIRDVRYYRRAVRPEQLTSLAVDDPALAGRWLAPDAAADSFPEARFVTQPEASAESPQSLLAGLQGDTDGCRFDVVEGRLCVVVPPSSTARRLLVWMADPLESTEATANTADRERIETRVASLLDEPLLSQQVQQPAQPLWPEVLTTTVVRGATGEFGFAVDTLTPPAVNPWLARLRLGGLDFGDDGDRMIVCTWDGDVYEVRGLAELDDPAVQPSPALTWRRVASGLFQPLGVMLVDGVIHVTCRDQLVRLHDVNGDSVIDFYECFNNDQQVTEHFHEFAMGLQRDPQGNFYYAKSARHALTALVPHHGTLLKVSPDGRTTEIVAAGFRAANGVCLNPDGSFIVTDQEGHWNPKNRINWVRPGRFYGNMFGYHNVTSEADDAMEQPLCWITNAFDRSPAELLWVPESTWGNLQGTLLNLSYGYGKVYIVPHEQLPHDGDSRERPQPTVQGGMAAFPIDGFPTGIMRGRFHPTDGGLYVCGLFAWASSQQTQEGGLFRIRYAGRGAWLPVATAAVTDAIRITFSDPIDPETTADLSRFAVTTWGLVRSKNYGSDHINEQPLAITAAHLSADRRTLSLTIPSLAPTWCYELRCQLLAEGRPVTRVMHGTTHRLRPATH